MPIIKTRKYASNYLIIKHLSLIIFLVVPGNSYICTNKKVQI